MAARIREELAIAVEIKEGHYGEFTVLVDGEPVARSGLWGFLGVLPSAGSVIRNVREKLGIAPA